MPPPPPHQYYHPYDRPYYHLKLKRPGRGFGIASMVLGIIGTAYSFIPFVSSLVFAESFGEAITGIVVQLSVFAVLALIFSIVSIKKRIQKRCFDIGNYFEHYNLCLVGFCYDYCKIKKNE